MGLSRRFQNLILDNHYAGAKSMLSIDLTRQLFGDTPTPPPTTIIGQGSQSALLQDSTSHTPAAANSSKPKKNLTAAVAAALNMERIRLRSPIFTFQAPPNEPTRKIDCFPLSDRKTLWVDHLGRPLLFDPEVHELEPMTCLHKPKSMPLSLFVPNADADNDYGAHDCRGSTLFVMEKAPDPELNCSTPWSDQFEAFVYCNPTLTRFSKLWQWQLLPPPPYVREHNHWQSGTRPEISSYASLGSHICISVEGVGTYCLDTASHTWRKVGNWTLPFHGRIEYVPELKLWFGFTTEARHLAAADLSALDMDSPPQPQLVTGPWMKELYFPEEWKECKDSQLVNLGPGRFCILRFFHTHNQMNGGNIAVFTGVEVVPRVQDANGGSGKVELQMIPHKSLYHESKGTTIDSVL